MKRTLFILFLGWTAWTAGLSPASAQTPTRPSSSGQAQKAPVSLGGYFDGLPGSSRRRSPAPIISAEDLMAGLKGKEANQGQKPTTKSAKPTSTAKALPKPAKPTKLSNAKSAKPSAAAAKDVKPVAMHRTVSKSKGSGGCDDGSCGPACDSGSCGSIGCDMIGCDSIGCDSIGKSICGKCGVCCCGCGWKHCVSFFGEYLYLRVRDNEVPYAVEHDGPLTTPTESILQVGPTAVVDQDYTNGYRGGFGVSLGCYTELRASYTYFDTSRDDELARNDINNVVRSLVRHPSSINIASDGVFATAKHDIRMDMIDVEFRNLWSCGCNHEISWLVGARYGRLEQDFESFFGVNGTDRVLTDVDFDGGGIRLGLEGERRIARHFMVYGKAAVSFLAGEFTADYLQQSATDPSVVNTNWNSGQVISIWDLEVGSGLVSRCGRFRLTAGYAFSLWDNIVKTDEWIKGVQANEYEHLGDQMTLDGFVVRGEMRF